MLPIDKLLYGGYSTISLGYAGLYECVKYMTGKSHTDPAATPFALEIMQHMNDACKRWKEKTDIDFSLYGTPLESTTYKFAKCLQKRFGLVPGITDKSYITYKILDLADLTVDGTMCTGGAVCIMMMLSGQNVFVAMLAATLAGMLTGLVTGVFHTFMGIPAILAGILTQLSLYSINLKIMGKANQAINVDKYNLLVSLRYIKNVPFLKNTLFVVAICIILLVLLLYWFFGTEVGCALRATGCNGNMSRAQGINTNLTKVLGLMLSNGLVGLSGALLSQYQGFADVNMGRGAIVIGLAAVIIGEVLGEAVLGKKLFIGDI